MDRPTSEPTDSQTNPSGSDEAPKSEALTPSEILETPNPPTSTGDQEPAKPSSASAWSKYKKYLKNAFTTSGVIGLIQDKHITLKNSVLALVTFGLERLVDSELFDCPLEKHQVYGNCFLYVPVFLLFCANVLIIGEVWQLSGRCFIRRYRRRGDVIARLIPSGIIKALVGPAAWLIATFASGQYYVCATVGPSIAKRRNLTGNITEAEEKALVAEIDLRTADSHIYAWVVFVIITALGAATIITRNCFLKDDMLLKNPYNFERREAAGAIFAFLEFMSESKFHQKLTEAERESIKLNFGDDDDFHFYLEGYPETQGRKNVINFFKEANNDYLIAFAEFTKKYPRAVTGNPIDPWRSLTAEEAQALVEADPRERRSRHSSVEMTPLMRGARR